MEVEQPKEVCRPFELDFLVSAPHILAASSKSLGETSEKRQFEVAGEKLLVRKKKLAMAVVRATVERQE